MLMDAIFRSRRRSLRFTFLPLKQRLALMIGPSGISCKTIRVAKLKTACTSRQGSRHQEGRAYSDLLMRHRPAIINCHTRCSAATTGEECRYCTGVVLAVLSATS